MGWDGPTTTNVVVAALSAVATGAAAYAAWKSATASERAVAAADRSAAAAEGALQEQRRAIEQADRSAAKAAEFAREAQRQSDRRDLTRMAVDGVTRANEAMRDIGQMRNTPSEAKAAAEHAIQEIEALLPLLDSDALPGMEAHRHKMQLRAKIAALSVYVSVPY